MFIDESIRDSYVMAGVVVSTQHLGQYRRAMASLRTKGSSALHMGNERRQQRQTALVLLRDLDYIQIKRVESKARFQDLARRECLELLVLSLNRSFSWVGAMHVGRRVLDVRLLARNECLDFLGRFIVQFVKFGSKAALLAECVDFLVCAQEFFFLSAFDWYALDVIGIIDVEDAQIFHPFVADSREHPSLVAAHESF